MSNIFKLIDELVTYSKRKDLLADIDKSYIINRIIMILGIDEYKKVEESTNYDNRQIDEILADIKKWALEKKVILEDNVANKEIFDAQIMNEFMPRPSEVIKEFNIRYMKSPKEATDYFFELSRSINYIQGERIKKNQSWQVATCYGNLDITINLSKPEKDPREIAQLKNEISYNYPKCLLCRENEGYYGRINHPARSNLRLIPIEINKENWLLQYSPYAYYNEHCILLKEAHLPMKIDQNTISRLFEFVEKFPHYFIGSNADLPIVGGSILNHDHFQGGRHEFPMMKAKIEKSFKIIGYEDVDVSILKWPMSVIRLAGNSSRNIMMLAEHIILSWQNYSDETAGILAYTGETPHNTITPIARKKGQTFELDIVLRNNRTNEEHPLGIFHPHEDVQHIKKENIGLIEVMGLAILPARLKLEIQLIIEKLIDKVDEENLKCDPQLEKHRIWYRQLYNKYLDLNKLELYEALKFEIGIKFQQVLEDSGVFKTDQAGISQFTKFIDTL